MTTTGPTFITLSPQTLSDLLVVGIENATWLQSLIKIHGLNKTEPFYACREFWRSPFEIEYETRDRVGTITFDDLSDTILTVAQKYPDILATFEKGNFTARQADQFARLLFGGRHG